MLCDYGCGNEAKYQLKNGKWCCCKHYNSCPAVKEKVVKGIMNSPKHTKEKYILRWKNMSQESKKRMNWNKGLTKETDERIRKSGLTLSKNIRAGISKHNSGRASTNEKELLRRRKISLKRIEYLEKSPHILWKTLSNGIKVQGNWEYNVGEKLLQKGYNVNRIRLPYNNIHVYTPDFYLGDDKYIEVKGWLSNRDVEKYKKVMKEYPNIKIYLMENKNYKKFINDEISLEECPDLYDIISRF